VFGVVGCLGDGMWFVVWGGGGGGGVGGSVQVKIQQLSYDIFYYYTNDMFRP